MRLRSGERSTGGRKLLKTSTLGEENALQEKKKLIKKARALLEVKNVRGCGKGVFVKTLIKKGTYLARYYGEYIKRLPEKDSFYLVGCGQGYIDARKLKRDGSQGVAHLINTVCKRYKKLANCYFVKNWIETEVYVVTKCDIRKAEQCWVCYGWHSHPCSCIGCVGK